jgi:hypothetical protein
VAAGSGLMLVFFVNICCHASEQGVGRVAVRTAHLSASLGRLEHPAFRGSWSPLR